MGEIGSIEIVIKGGRPWGFTLQGGAESRSAVTVAQIEPKGKADLQGSLKVGDHVLKINDVQCFSLVDATQLIDCAFRTLTIHIWRSKKVVIVPNDSAQEEYRSSSNPKNPCRQHHDEEDKYMQKILPDNLPYPGGYNKHAMIRKDIPKPQNFVLPCHSYQSSHEWVQYDHKEMSSLEDRAFSPQDCCGPSLASDSRSVAAAAVISQEHYEVNDSFNRHLRSPRSLTKDSGYETCAQVEHDYVNLEWMTNVPYSKRSAAVVSPGRYQVSSILEVFPTNERPHNHYGRHAMLSSSLASEKGSHQSSSTGSVSFPCSDYSDPFPPLRNSSASSSKYSESYNNLYSSTESLSSHTSKPESVHLRSSKSSLSLIRDSKSHIYDHQVSTSCQYSFVSPAQSTPNLNYCNKMAPRRVNKKTSVYEELASKSGFDFSPMIQSHRQPLQKAITKGEATISESHLPYASKVNVGSFPSVPENCDKTNSRASYRNHCESIENEGQVYYESKLPTGIPPPVPARDSSLKYRASLSHEKFPSWPVVPVENEINCSSVHSSGYRSNSWTEKTGCVKDFDGSYSRPKNNFQISTQQLHPVQERNHSGSSNNRIAPTENRQLTKEAIQYSNEEDSASLDISFNMLSKHLDSESSYEKCEKYINNHTPPDRNLITPVPLSDDESVLTYIEKYDSDDYFQQSSNLYENVKRNGNHYHSTTPLLDMLRSESKDLSESCVSHQHVGPKSETSTYISSNSSSQETLKRYNSFSDLSSVHTFTRNDSPSLESEVNSIYDENLNKGLKKGTSVAYSNMSSSEASAQSSKAKHPPLGFNTAPRVIAGVSYEQKKTASSRAEIKKIPQGLDRPNKRCSRNYINNRPDITTGNENSKEKSSSPYYASTTKTYSEEANILESKVRMVDYLYSSVQSEKERNNNNSTQVVTPSPQKLHHEKSIHHFGGQKQYRRTVSVPGTITPRHLSDHGHYRHHRESSSAHSRNGMDNLETSNKFNQNLKALQKQAVLSFYHRQTMASKNFAEKRARSSSFSHSREASTTEFSSVPVSLPTPNSHNKYVQSSRSSSQPLSPASSCKSAAQLTTCEKHDEGIEFELRFNFQGKLTSSTNFCPQIERCVDKSYDKTPVSVSSTLNQEQDPRKLDVVENVRQNDKIVFVPNTPKQEEQDPRKSDVAENEKNDSTLVFVPSTLRQEQEDSKKVVLAENVQQNNQVSPFTKEYINEASDKKVAVKLPQELTSGRKAFFQKTYNPNKSAVVRVISSDGETVAQNVITKNCGKTMSKPQVPPKRFYKAISVPPVMPEDNFVPSILAENEEEELLDIQMCHVALPLKATSVSPDLPPPPPPLNMERGTINEDDPFPPPPDPLDILVKGSEVFPQHYNPNVSAVPMKEENKQSNSYSLPLSDVFKVVDDVPTYKDEETNVHNVPIRTSPNENYLHILSLHSNETIESVSPEMSNSEKAYENEAIYVNLPFQLEVSEKSAVDNTPMAFTDTTPIISVTNTGTQTSEMTPLVQQTNRISYLVSMYEDKQPRISTAKKEAKHTLSPTEVQPPVTSYNINKMCSNKQIETSLAKDAGSFNFDSCASGGKPIVKSIKSLNDKINLPVTFSYFTTSEAKAKLLTRYCHSFHGNLIDNGDIECQKDDLVESISKKLDVMRLEQIKIKEEVEQNEELGRDVKAKFEKVAKPNEIEKYKTHVNELEKIVRILLSLSGRLTRAENALHILSKDDQSEEKIILEAKKNKLIEQLDDALQLKECIDKRSDVVSHFLNNYLSKEDYADYEHFIQMKPKLLIDSKEIDDNIQLGEEQLLALNGTFPGSHDINDELVNNNIDLTERVLGKH